MAMTLQARHLAPTAPDTLACYPFTDADPFVLPSRYGRVTRAVEAGPHSARPTVRFAH
jgi:hypothetical protein